MMTQPFVYIIRNINTGIKYAGVKFSKGCRPTDLLTKYFTSSKIVKRLILEDSNCFVIEKIIEFDTKDKAIEFEELLLLTENAHMSDKWYNLSISGAINPDHVKSICLKRYGVENWMQSDEAKSMNLGFQQGNTYGNFERTQETKDKMSIAFTGRKYSDEHNKKLAAAKTGTKAAQETKDKMSAMRTGVPRPKSFSDKMSIIMKGENNPMFGKESPRRGTKDPTIECEHCGIRCNKGNYNRWHGSRCKLNTINI